MPEPAATIPLITGRQLLPQLARIQSDTLGFLLDTVRLHGDLVHFDLGITHAYLVNQPEAIKHILLDNHRNYSKDTIQYNALAAVTGRGLLTSDGEQWFRNRRLEQPAFARPKLAALDQVVIPAVQAMLDRWQAQLAVETHPVIDLDAAMMQVTLEVVGKALFGIDLSREAQSLTTAVLTCLDHIIYKARQMIVPPDWVPTPRNLRFRGALRRLDKAVYGLIDARQASGEPGSDLLGMLLQARDPHSGQAMSRLEVRDEVITLLIAGHETVASALTWTYFLLARHPQAGDRLRSEVQAVLGGRLPTTEDLPRLAYTGRVFDEALRLYPPAWLITRKSIAADELDGKPVRAGALMIISPYAVQRSAEVWEDPCAFEPDRFAAGEEDRRPRFAYIPFGGGPRLCIGNHFALTEARLILAMVAQRFRLDLLPGADVRPDPLVTIRPRGGLPMKIIAL
jgi:cytochrome P450